MLRKMETLNRRAISLMRIREQKKDMQTKVLILINSIGEYNEIRVTERNRSKEI